MEEIAASEEFLLKEIHRQQQNVAQHIEDSLIIGFSTYTGRLRAQSAHVKEQGHTVPLEVLETLVKVSDSLNMEHAAFEHRKALKMDEMSKKQEEGTSALTAAVAEEKVVEDVQADVVPEALPAMMLNQEMTARSKHHLSGSAAELISAGLPNVLQKRPPKKLWGNLPGLSALQPPPGSSLSRLQSPLGGRRKVGRRTSIVVPDDESHLTWKPTPPETPQPSWRDLMKQRKHAAHLKRLLVRMTTVKRVDFEQNHAARIIQAAWKHYKGQRAEGLKPDSIKKLELEVSKHRAMEAALKLSNEVTWSRSVSRRVFTRGLSMASHSRRQRSTSNTQAFLRGGTDAIQLTRAPRTTSAQLEGNYESLEWQAGLRRSEFGSKSRTVSFSQYNASGSTSVHRRRRSSMVALVTDAAGFTSSHHTGSRHGSTLTVMEGEESGQLTRSRRGSRVTGSTSSKDRRASQVLLGNYLNMSFRSDSRSDSRRNSRTASTSVSRHADSAALALNMEEVLAHLTEVQGSGGLSRFPEDVVAGASLFVGGVDNAADGITATHGRVLVRSDLSDSGAACANRLVRFTDHGSALQSEVVDGPRSRSKTKLGSHHFVGDIGDAVLTGSLRERRRSAGSPAVQPEAVAGERRRSAGSPAVQPEAVAGEGTELVDDVMHHVRDSSVREAHCFPGRVVKKQYIGTSGPRHRLAMASKYAAKAAEAATTPQLPEGPLAVPENKGDADSTAALTLRGHMESELKDVVNNETVSPHSLLEYDEGEDYFGGLKQLVDSHDFMTHDSGRLASLRHRSLAVARSQRPSSFYDQIGALSRLDQNQLLQHEDFLIKDEGQQVHGLSNEAAEDWWYASEEQQVLNQDGKVESDVGVTDIVEATAGAIMVQQNHPLDDERMSKEKLKHKSALIGPIDSAGSRIPFEACTVYQEDYTGGFMTKDEVAAHSAAMNGGFQGSHSPGGLEGAVKQQYEEANYGYLRVRVRRASAGKLLRPPVSAEVVRRWERMNWTRWSQSWEQTTHIRSHYQLCHAGQAKTAGSALRPTPAHHMASHLNPKPGCSTPSSVYQNEAEVHEMPPSRSQQGGSSVQTMGGLITETSSAHHTSHHHLSSTSTLDNYQPIHQHGISSRSSSWVHTPAPSILVLKPRTSSQSTRLMSVGHPTTAAATIHHRRADNGSIRSSVDHNARQQRPMTTQSGSRSVPQCPASPATASGTNQGVSLHSNGLLDSLAAGSVSLMGHVERQGDGRIQPCYSAEGDGRIQPCYSAEAIGMVSSHDVTLKAAAIASASAETTGGGAGSYWQQGSRALSSHLI